MQAGMAVTGTMTLKGAAELLRKLEALPRKVQGKVARHAARAGAKAALPYIVAEAPVGATGALKRSHRVRAAKLSRRRRGVVGMSVLTGEGFFKGETYYGGFVHLGHHTASRRARRRAALAGQAAPGRKVPPNPWMKRGMQKAAGTAIAAVMTDLRQGIEGAMKS